jgi:hypothetical protein
MNWKFTCSKYNKKHIYTVKPCPSCGVNETVQIKSDKVAEKCHQNNECEGCEAYRDHYR